MNILFFLTPKSEVAYIYEDYTIKQAIETMEHYRYSSIPIINRDGEYIGTITEGDFLWSLKNKYTLNLKELEKMPVTEIKRKKDNAPVAIDAKIEDLVIKSLNQNFVPVIDDQNIFIGIIKRREIIGYCFERMSLQEEIVLDR
ncbi:CBS domain-containing protein [Metaclostridioides mangenotii]|uniref:CBS domain-containing protein n=1 Tax=Metaclostridioides mangenotii TaxID=1540 RepID=UPI0004676676|nr:CBS domain-containing protein [Clostridioides mangenotii]